MGIELIHQKVEDMDHIYLSHAACLCQVQLPAVQSFISLFALSKTFGWRENGKALLHAKIF